MKSIINHPFVPLTAALACLGLAVIACSAGDDSGVKKDPIAVCQAGEKGCPSEKKESSTKRAANEDGTRLGSPETADGEGESNSNADAGEAGADGAPSAPREGPFCQELRACCKTLEQAGYSPNTCLEIVNTKSENACVLQHKQYRDAGDC